MKKPVIVTTIHKGVFFGYLQSADHAMKIATLERARLCVYWSADTKELTGLAAAGP